MKRHYRQRSQSEEEESVFVPITDMTVSFLFIVMILLAFFATQISTNDLVSRKKFEQMRDDRNIQHEKVVSLTRDKAQLESDLDSKQSELDSKQSELNQTIVQLNELKKKNFEILGLLEDLRAQLESIQKEKQELIVERDELRERNKELVKLLNDLHTNLDEINNRLKDKQLDSQELVVERDKLLEKNRELVGLLNESRIQIEILNNELDQVQKAEKETIGERAKLRAENLELKSLLASVHSKVDELKKQLEKRREINPLEAYFAAAIEKRYEIIRELRDRLLIEFPELEVVISPEQDALRFQGEGLFRSDSYELQSQQRQIVESIGNLLDEILGCYTLGVQAERGVDCDSGLTLIEAVQIEGHTDSDGEDMYNLNLSTLRAISTFQVIWESSENVLSHVNIRNQPVLSVAGYGEMRPVATNLTDEGKSTNRRIDLRFIMYAPSDIEELEELGRRIGEIPNRRETDEN